jgi:lysophospholipase L1-like esterase
MANEPERDAEWFLAIPSWSSGQRRCARWVGVAFAALFAAVPLVRLVSPAPAATPAPLPAWSWADFRSGDWMDQLDRHLKETSWLTVALRSVHDDVLRAVGAPRPTGLQGQFRYQTADGEFFGHDQYRELLERGFIVPVPGEVGRELPRPRLMIAPNQTFYLCYSDNALLRRDWLDAQGRVSIRLEGHGMRERPEVTTTPKPVGQLRVLCLGDSLTFGWGVPEQLGWVRLLEDALRADGRDVRTVNCGAAGTVCIDEYAAALQFRFAALEPDAVVVGVCLNDLIPSNGLSVLGPQRPERSLAQALQGAPVRGPLDLDPGVDWVGLLLNLPRDEGVAGGLYSTDKPFEAMWSQGSPQRSLRAMKAFCDARKIPFVVALWPFLQGMGEGRHYPFARLHELVAADCREAGIAFVDLLPVLRDVPQEDLWVTPADMHPNPRAHRLAVPAIEAALRRAWLR